MVAALAWSEATCWLARTRPAWAGPTPELVAASAAGSGRSDPKSSPARPRASAGKPAATAAGPGRVNPLRELAQARPSCHLFVLTNHSNNSGNSRHRTHLGRPSWMASPGTLTRPRTGPTDRPH
jgi:hypothetical protein